MRAVQKQRAFLKDAGVVGEGLFGFMTFDEQGLVLRGHV